MPSAGERMGTRIVQDLFGTPIQSQGRGFYVSLEFFAIVRGVLESNPENLLSPEKSPIEYQQISHDFARRIATKGPISAENLSAAVSGDQTLDILHALFSSLIVEIPGRRKSPEWFAAHLYPFVGELVHYDAVRRRGEPKIERYQFRDGGGWAYHVLRTDSDTERRENTAALLTALLTDSNSALGRVAKALHAHDAASALIFADNSESETENHEELSPWPEHLRRGVNWICARSYSPKAKRTEQLMHWIPYCLARHELAVARGHLGLDREYVTIDATRDSANQLRANSQSLVRDFSWQITQALTSRAKELSAGDNGDDAADRWSRFLEPNAKFTHSPKAFFLSTMAAVGALNAASGKRHFTFKPPLLDALVCASIVPGAEVEYNEFLRQLFDKYALVISHRTANETGLTLDIDAGVFSVNAEAFRSRLQQSGLLTHYSDATRLVHAEMK